MTNIEIKQSYMYLCFKLKILVLRNCSVKNLTIQSHRVLAITEEQHIMTDIHI